MQVVGHKTWKEEEFFLKLSQMTSQSSSICFMCLWKL